MAQTMERQSESVTAAVVERIADIESVGVYDVAPLFESIDPDALETIFAESSSSEHVRIEFSHAGYRVTIDGGRVSIDAQAD